ncbi:MAG: hypothetical protein IJA23_05885 [Clostridia bacterium]|nr:hypothetical protein [Clostridia bacterium]
MNNQSKQLIREFMSTHIFGTNGDYNFEELYNLFATLEVKDVVSLLNSPDDFQDFVIENINLIKSNQPILQYTLLVSLERFKSKLVKKLEYAFSTSNAMFAKTVNDLAPSRESKILDVGSGEIPSSSILLGGLKHKVTTMDSLIIMPKDVLSNLHVTLDKRFFGKNSPVKDFDFVVGKYPCNAIIPIVEECSAANKPYLIKLCNHNIPGFKFDTLDWREGWKRILPDIDSYIKFYDEYAFNIDLSEESVKKIIDLYEGEIPRCQKQSIVPLVDTSNFDLENLKFSTSKSQNQPQPE